MSIIDSRPTTLLDRITAAKAAFLDAAISSRAAAATALSTVQWTNARAAKLDNLDAAISSIGQASPTALVGPGKSNSELYGPGNTYPGILYVEASTSTYDSWTNLINLTSSAGVLTWLNFFQQANASNRDVQVRLTVDGNVVYLSDSNLFQAASDNDTGVVLVGMSMNFGVVYSMGQLPFTDSLKLDFKKTENASGTVTLRARPHYYLT